MDFGLTELQQTVQRETLALASGFGLEYWREHDRDEAYPWEFVRTFAAAGWLGIVIPEVYGGSGLGLTEAGLLLHAVGRSGAGTSGASALHFYIFPLTPVIRHGSEAMKRTYLPRAARGELLCAFGVTEPTAGTDTSRISTRAEHQGDRWIVNGQKVWTTNAQQADRILLLARSAPRRAEAPLQGLTLFFTNFDRSKCTVRKIEKLGRAAVDSNEVFIDGLEVPDEDVVGEVGRGFAHLLDGLNPERVVTAFEAIGIGQWAVEYASAYARDRRVFDRPIGQNQAVAHPLAHVWAELAAAELLAHKAAWLFDHEQPCGAEANAAKLLGAEAGFKACDAALQTLGGFGYAREFHVERLWREVRLFKIAPITQEMVLNYLAERVLGLPKSY
ncbi:MAG: acyl-CoA/acyl-ACP dehydrogenase [Chloroflexi bacterium]|nr:acyl-CoA/acyl-ACP dehydrogenase [Chloroflexota bacterium]